MVGAGTGARAASLGWLDGSLERACTGLLRHQHADGHFDGDCDQGTGPTAQTIVLESFLGVLDPHDAAQGAAWLTSRAQPDGSFLAYPAATFATLAETCCAYAALKVAGVAEDDERRRRSRMWIDAHGGMRAADPVTQAYLVMAGLLPASALPEARIEYVLVPGIARFVGRTFALFYGVTLAFILPGLLHGLRRGGGRRRPRSPAVKAEQKIVDYLLDHQNPEGSWAGSQWVTAMALACLRSLGLETEHDAIRRGVQSLRGLRRSSPEGLSVIPFNADVWNTSMALRVLQRAGRGGDEWAQPAVLYLLEQQTRVAAPADWTNARPGAPRSGGWAFESGNPLSPDADTTSVTLLALSDFAGHDGVPAALERGMSWMRSLQHEDGGFGSFARPTRVAPPMALFTRRADPPQDVLAAIGFFLKPPFEFAEIPTADLTSRVTCALARVGPASNGEARDRAVRFLLSQQLGDSWWGRWTTNYLAATAFVLTGLAEAGVDAATPAVRDAVRWIGSCQNADGGFGERNETYENPALRGQGPSNAYLTGLVLLALCLTGDGSGDVAARAARQLHETQGEDGLWEDFQAVQSMAPPELFYMNYVNFQTAPIEGLACYRAVAGRGSVR